MTGYARKRRGEQHHGAKLTETKVCELRRLVNQVGVCKVCAAKLVGVNRATAWDAASYKTWRHVP